MTNWNYRIVRYLGKTGYGLHEVYYRNGEPWTMTTRPTSFACDDEEGSEGIVGSLEMAIHDAKTRPILDEPEEWELAGEVETMRKRKT